MSEVMSKGREHFSSTPVFTVHCCAGLIK